MAGLGKKTFTAGEVLTAADVNGYLMEQSVMVFGGTAARSSAIPTPSEGMVTYLSDLNDIQAYDGSNWISTGLTAGTTTANYGWPIPASGSIASLGTAIDTTVAGLAQVETVLTSGTFTTQSAVNVSNFLSDTYKFYRIYLNVIGSTTLQDLNFRFRENVTDKATTYYAGGVYGSFTGTVASFGNKNNATELRISSVDSSNYSWINIDLHRNAATTASIITSSYNSPQGFYTANGGANLAMTNVTGFSIYPASGTITGYYILTGIKA